MECSKINGSAVNRPEAQGTCTLLVKNETQVWFQAACDHAFRFNQYSVCSSSNKGEKRTSQDVRM